MEATDFSVYLYPVNLLKGFITVEDSQWSPYDQ